MFLHKKNIILSFDYELFFGDNSGTVQKTLIEPTNAILDAMDSVGFKGNFFVDWQMLKKLKEENTERTLSDYNQVKEQLKDLIRRGHRIELHIHPHWVDAKYNGDGTWNYSDFHHYSLNSFSEDEIVDMFKEGAALLTNIAREVDPSYKLCAFRAGGWAVQPFAKVKKGLKAVNISIDSSVMPGVAIEAIYSNCDFLNAPTSTKGWYRFEDDVCLISESGSFIEVPITRAKRGILGRIINKVFGNFYCNFTKLSDGCHERKNDIPDKWKSNGIGLTSTFSNRAPYVNLLVALEEKKDIICFIDHPKDITRYTCKNIKLMKYVSKSLLYKDMTPII